VELDELAHHPVATQQLGDGEHQVGGGGAGRQLPGEAEAHHRRHHQRQGLPSMTASASMPPIPQPRTPRPLTMVVCESVPRHTRILQLDVAVPRVRAPEDVGDDGMIGDELGGDHGAHRLRVSAESGQRVADGGEVDQGGHPVGVMQEHPCRVQDDLVTSLGGGPHRLDLLGGDQPPVLVAQQVLQQHLEGVRQPVNAQPVQPVELPPAPAEQHRIAGLQAVHRWALLSRPV
jgi:hypothetical protein